VSADGKVRWSNDGGATWQGGEPAEASLDLTGMAQSYALRVDILRTVAEGASGYRRTLEAQGWPAHIVDHMAGTVLATWTAESLRDMMPRQAES
jgi:hypothetical protein